MIWFSTPVQSFHNAPMYGHGISLHIFTSVLLMVFDYFPSYYSSMFDLYLPIEFIHLDPLASILKVDGSSLSNCLLRTEYTYLICTSSCRYRIHDILITYFTL